VEGTGVNQWRTSRGFSINLGLVLKSNSVEFDNFVVFLEGI